MKNFVDLKIDGETFESQFYKLFRSNEKAVNKLKTDLEQLNLFEPNQINPFEPNPKSFGFTVWISELELGCDEFYPDFQPQDQVEFRFARDEENFRAFVADIIPQIQKYCEE